MQQSKTCSQVRFLIFRHPLVPLFQQSRKSDPPFLSFKVDQHVHNETSKIAKTPLKQKKIVSDFAQILCEVSFYHKDFNFQKNSFDFFFSLYPNVTVEAM